MEIPINNSRTIGEVQRDFSKEFPFLKIEFFDAPYKVVKAQPHSKMFPHHKKLSACRKADVGGKLKIKKSDTVNDLENEFWKIFGLSVQVFRKSDNLWIETSLSYSWTLEQQNREGFEMSTAHKNPYKEAEETDLTDRNKWE